MQGFTLIEIMITVAIIGVMVMIAIPQYNNYIIKTYIASAYSEISIGKTEYEILHNNSESAVAFTPENVGLRSSTSYCNVAVNPPNSLGTQSQAISCLLKGHAQMNGARIDLARVENGRWLCIIRGNVPDQVKPSSCD